MSKTNTLFTDIDSERIYCKGEIKEGEYLLLLLHGYGNDNVAFYKELESCLPEDVTVVSLRAPLDLVAAQEGPEVGYGWFLFGDEEAQPQDVLLRSAQQVLDWLNTLNVSGIGLMGFSQGGAMTAQLLRLAPEKFDFAVNLSGFIWDPTPQPNDAVLAAGVEREVAFGSGSAKEIRRVESFWGFGDADTVLPEQIWEQTETWLRQHTTPEIRIYAGMEHDIIEQEKKDIASFIRRHLDNRPQTRRSVELERPVVQTARWQEQSLEGKDLVVMLHGFGSHENDLTRWASAEAPGFGRHLPGVARLTEGPVYVSVQAPIPEAMGYAWFTRQNHPEGYSAEAARRVADAVNDWYTQLTAKWGKPRRTTFLGFSQGGAVVAQLLRQHPESVTSAVILNGFVVNDDLVPAAKRPVLWVRGGKDQMIGADREAAAQTWLRENTELTEITLPELGHEINDEVIAKVNEYLSNN